MSPYTIRDRFRTRPSFSWPDGKEAWLVMDYGTPAGSPAKILVAYSGIGAEQSARLRAEELNAKESE